MHEIRTGVDINTGPVIIAAHDEKVREATNENWNSRIKTHLGHLNLKCRYLLYLIKLNIMAQTDLSGAT